MVRSAWLPTDTNRAKPCRSAVSSNPTSSARLPDCETSETPPVGWSPPVAFSPACVSSSPRQFGPSSSMPAARARLDQAVLHRLALGPHLAEPGGDHRHRLDAELHGLGHRTLHRGRRDRQDREVGRLVQVEQRRHRLLAEHVAAAPRHHADRRVAGLAQQADREPSAPLHAVVGGADQRDRARLEQRRQVSHAPSIRSTPRFSRPRATISRWISDVPSQMRSTRSSRRNRSATLVRM